MAAGLGRVVVFRSVLSCPSSGGWMCVGSYACNSISWDGWVILFWQVLLERWIDMVTRNVQLITSAEVESIDAYIEA